MIAAVLSTAIWPGLGQLYLGRTGRGFACMAGVVALLVVTGATAGGDFTPLALVVGMAAGGVDAWRVARDT